MRDESVRRAGESVHMRDESVRRAGESVRRAGEGARTLDESASRRAWATASSPACPGPVWCSRNVELDDNHRLIGEARKEGVRIAREMLFGVRDRVQGAYLMPPLGKYELALDVLDGLKR
jgi:hypothetical protein